MLNLEMSADLSRQTPEEVVGSIPISSTTSDEFRRHQRGPDGRSRMQSLSTARSFVEHAGGNSHRAEIR
jgi:hypothetical protein